MSLNHSNATRRVPGAPMPGQSNRLVNQEEVAMQSDKYAWQNLDRRIDEDDRSYEARQETNFPVVPFDRTPRDTLQEAKSTMVRDGMLGGAQMQAVVNYGDQDVEYMLQKAKQAEYAEFDNWMGQKFDLTDPAQVRIFESINPQYFQRRAEVLNAAIDLTGKYAKLKLMGAKNEDDLKLEWMVETQRLRLPEGPLWDPSSWKLSQLGGGNENQLLRSNAERYRQGFFNPWRATPDDKAGYKANPRNWFDIMGDPRQDSNAPLRGYAQMTTNPYSAANRYISRGRERQPVQGPGTQ